MEARVAGRGPIVVHHSAGTLPLAISGAAFKLKHAVERSLAKVASH
jgi:hypothetical protein